MMKQSFTETPIVHADNTFTQCVNAPDRFLDLAKAALLIADEEYPNLNVETYLRRLDAIAETVRARLEPGATVLETLMALNRHLFDDLGFTGNVTDYYDPRNSFLNEVLDRRLGIPITLAIIYIEIGHRLRIPLEGIAFPGHFLVRLDLENGALILDPFFGGISLSESDLAERIASVFDSEPLPQLDLKQLLKSAGKKEILARMLRNLKGIYLHRKEFLKALSVSNRILAAAPESGTDIRDRGLILEHLQCPQAAVLDYRRYLTLAPEALDYQEIRDRMRTLEQSFPKLH